MMFRAVFLINYDGQELFLKQAINELPVELGGVEVDFEFFNTADIDADQSCFKACVEAVDTADFIYLYVPGGLPYFKSYNAIQQHFMGRIPSFVYSGIDDENNEAQRTGALSPLIYSQLMPYHLMSGVENLKSFLKLVLFELGGIGDGPAELVVPLWQGIYGLPEGLTEDQYLDYLAQSKDRAVIGVLFHRHNMLHENTRHIDALIEEITQAGALPLAVYSNIMPMGDGDSGLRGALARYFMDADRSRIDTLIVTTGFSLSILSAPGDGSGIVEQSIFEPLDVPVLQAMFTYMSYEQWQQSEAGLEASMLATNVFQPEFDGQIITVPIAYSEPVQTTFGAKYVVLPIADRVRRVVRLALNWARLRATPFAAKKVAIVLHNMPPRADMIGCAYGLDTPQSVFNVYRMLAANELVLEREFADGQEIIAEITAGVTNDGRFMSEPEMLARSTATVRREVYAPWFDGLPERVIEQISRDWGAPPGQFMVADEAILIPGIINGNLFIGLQPPRAFEEKAEESYHNTDIVCPWQYLAFYRYLEEVFAADCVIHMGTHGTIEWLPGKEAGLSEECYPDIAIGEMPHLYPYIIDIPGEGAQAKRRTDAVVVDHLIPSMTESGSYDQLAAIEEQITQYYQALTADPGKCAVIAEQLWPLVEAANLDSDLGLVAEGFFADVNTAIERLHLWISEIKTSKVKDGLHIFGQVPVGERYSNLLRLLVNVANGSVASLREALAAWLGEDLEALLADPGHIMADGRTAAMLLEQIDAIGSQVFAVYVQSDFDIEAALGVVRSVCEPADSQPLLDCLRFVAEQAMPRLNQTTDELLYLQRGIEGRFVPPGPSGSPSRGNALILPTGRNFYMIDPSTIPSRSAWTVGQMLGDQLLDRYLDEQGAYPESVAIVVYAGETIKTTGDDIAEIMYLYGVRPVWLGDSNRLIDLEVIPLSELGRPRIDVTLRISGLFRDCFPNLIERIEDAVNLVAALDEPDDSNYVKKHVNQDFAAFIASGMQREQAFEYARYRVFSDPPGTYGAGVDTLIYSRQWESSDDLGQAYINWGAHAYGKKLHGTKLTEVFVRRLEQTEVTVKNVSSVESDMLDSDDFFNYHGGLISAVKKERGSLPLSLATNAGDPKHVKTKSIHEETSRIMRSRINNPVWIEGLKEHGFRGAQEFSAMVDIVFGWDATSDVVDDWMYTSITNTYLLDEELQEWIRANNPWALLNISERLLEAAQRGMWDADEEMLDQIRQIYLSIEGDLEDS